MKPFAKRILALARAAALTMTTLPAVCGTEHHPLLHPGAISIRISIRCSYVSG